MKKWMYVAAAFIAAGILARLPHPAKDISELEPVQLVYVYEEAGALHIETDTGAHGSGKTLSEASESMRAQADGEIFLETAEFLLMDPDVTVTAEFFALLRPSCNVFYTQRRPDLTASAQYLTIHPPKQKLRDLRSAAVSSEPSEGGLP